MGEYADEAIDRLIFGSRRRVPRTKWNVTCNRCGVPNLKWRDTDAGWRLFEDERIEHNRLKPHECNPPSEDDFDVVSE